MIFEGLGGIWKHLGGIWKHLGDIWRCLGTPGRVLLAQKEGLGCQEGSQRRPELRACAQRRVIVCIPAALSN